MIEGRIGFGLCNMRNFIYVFGGITCSKTGERFNILTNHWQNLPMTWNLVDDFCTRMTMEVFKNCIFSFGGVN